MLTGEYIDWRKLKVIAIGQSIYFVWSKPNHTIDTWVVKNAQKRFIEIDSVELKARVNII